MRRFERCLSIGIVSSIELTTRRPWYLHFFMAPATSGPGDADKVHDEKEPVCQTKAPRIFLFRIGGGRSLRSGALRTGATRPPLVQPSKPVTSLHVPSGTEIQHLMRHMRPESMRGR